MTIARLGALGRAVVLLLVAVAISTAASAETLRIGAQMTGSLGWELDYMKAKGLDAGIELSTVDLATTDAGKIAIASGAVDVVLSDWLWVARERALGHKLVFVAHSAAVGALMARPGVGALADLKGKSLGVAGGPLDKSWVLLQAYAKTQGVDLSKEATLAYAAPPLLNQKAQAGELDATLQFWTFCAALQAKGFTPLVEIADVEKALGAKGPVAMVGFVFNEKFAAEHADLIARFLDAAAKTREALAADSEAWRAIVARIGAKFPYAAELYQARYAAGVVKRPIDEEEQDAKTLFKTLAETGGAELVGPARELDPGVYYHPPGGG